MDGSDKGINMEYVLMTIAAIVLIGLIVANWYCVKSIITLKAGAASVLTELERIYASIADNEQESSRHKSSIDSIREFNNDLRDDISITQALITSETERIDRNSEEMYRYIDKEVETLRSYIDKRIDKSSNKKFNIDESELVKSVTDLVMAFRNAK